MTTDPRDQHIADLRTALQRAAAELGFVAGQVAAADPAQAERMMAAASAAEDVLRRAAS